MSAGALERNPFRSLPSVDELVRTVQPHRPETPRAELVEAARAAIQAAREELGSGGAAPPPGALVDAVLDGLERARRGRLQRVINATGVVLHTNFGRAPLPEAALQAVADIGAGYSNLEFDLEAGGRGRRDAHCADALCKLSGAEAALVVNNNAAALLLVLSALCAGREVIVSRGELIEIGGSFRIPDVMAQSGAQLREVGTTNRTRPGDYRAAFNEATAAVLKVHTSNYKVIGFTEAASGAELAALAHTQGLIAIEDLGSGALADTRRAGLAHEPTLAEAVASGVDVVTASGDKLLGGPQAGLIVGRRDLVDACRRHPLARALRVDKLTLAALAATLDLYVARRLDEIPAWRMLLEPAESVRARAERLAGRLPSALRPEVRADVSAPGGGSLPGERLPTAVIVLRGASAGRLSARLRSGRPPVVGRVVDGELALDLRTVAPAEEAALVGALEAACT